MEIQRSLPESNKTFPKKCINVVEKCSPGDKTSKSSINGRIKYFSSINCTIKFGAYGLRSCQSETAIKRCPNCRKKGSILIFSHTKKIIFDPFPYVELNCIRLFSNQHVAFNPTFTSSLWDMHHISAPEEAEPDVNNGWENDNYGIWSSSKSVGKRRASLHIQTDFSTDAAVSCALFLSASFELLWSRYGTVSCYKIDPLTAPSIITPRNNVLLCDVTLGM